MLFSTWDRPRVLQAIQDLEEDLASSLASANSPSAGQVTQKADADLKKTLRFLYARLYEIDGDTAKAAALRGGVRFVHAIPTSGFHG